MTNFITPADSNLKNITVTFPRNPDGDISQDQEWCLVNLEGEERKIRFHDYHEIYKIPGLYEYIFYERMKCQSPQMIGALLSHEVNRNDLEMSDLRVLDVGAGNGIMGEVLVRNGAEEIVGVDILEEAAAAAQRDRPTIYSEYICADLTDMSPTVQESLKSRDFNCMTLIAALGFGDIPPEVFSIAFNMVRDDGMIAFNIKHEFMTGEESSEFSELILRMIQSKWFQPDMHLRYIHRHNVIGDALCYDAFVGKKIRNIPDRFLS